MPFKSEAQKGYLYANHPEIAKRWQKETPSGKLPAHVAPKKGKSAPPDPQTVLAAVKK